MAHCFTSALQYVYGSLFYQHTVNTDSNNDGVLVLHGENKMAGTMRNIMQCRNITLCKN